MEKERGTSGCSSIFSCCWGEGVSSGGSCSSSPSVVGVRASPTVRSSAGSSLEVIVAEGEKGRGVGG